MSAQITTRYMHAVVILSPGLQKASCPMDHSQYEDFERLIKALVCIFRHRSTLSPRPGTNFRQTKFRVCSQQRQSIFDLNITTGNSSGVPQAGRLISLWLHKNDLTITTN